MIQRIFFFISLLFLLSLSACKEQVSEAAVPESRITRVVTAMPVIQDYDETFTVAGDIRP